MYEQVSHSLLNRILDQLNPEIRKRDLRHFYTRLGANFYAIHSLFHHLYGQREDFAQQMLKLVEVMATRYIERHKDLKRLDVMREKDHNWFLSQEWVGMALYADGFSGNLEKMNSRLGYLQELGVNMVHIMPIQACPKAASDGARKISVIDNLLTPRLLRISRCACTASRECPPSSKKLSSGLISGTPSRRDQISAIAAVTSASDPSAGGGASGARRAAGVDQGFDERADVIGDLARRLWGQKPDAEDTEP